MIKSIIGYSFAFTHNSDIRTPCLCIHRFENFRVLSSALINISVKPEDDRTWICIAKRTRWVKRATFDVIHENFNVIRKM